ncbi:MAG: EAL domain-containing protein, partial [Lachnospiraceae bacterium]|nr:EAL domain-containing protein [Lachnospiraceae bacterium]
ADLENPDSYIDRETGVFTAHALMSLMSQRFEEGQTFAGINIVINMEENNLTRLMQRTMLVTVARRLELIPNATVFRNVANEFALVLPDAETMEQQLPIIRAMLEEPIDTEDGPVIMHPYYILFPDSTLANSADEVFAYHSFFMEHDPEVDFRVIDEQEVKRIREELAIRNEISEALRENRVEVHFHPIYSVKNGKFTSAEALARIRRKDGTLLMPGAFIPVAETSNQIIHVGEVVFEKVCQFLSQTPLGAYGLEYIEVNLSVEQCERKTLADEFIEIMNRYHVDPSCINLEVTESGSVRHRKTLLENMNKLIEAGVHFSLDDFGTGESNLDYIMNMPVHIVKFDRYFTQAYFTTERTKYVIDSVIEMIRGLNLQIVSEGVETQEQFDTLVDHKIDYIQGYYFAKPMPVEDFVFFIKTH